MNRGDFVYVYIHDLEKSLSVLKSFREDRFGKITNIQSIQNGKDNILSYDILLKNGTTIRYRTDNLTTNIILIADLIELVGRLDVSSDKKRGLLDQLNRIVF